MTTTGTLRHRFTDRPQLRACDRGRAIRAVDLRQIKVAEGDFGLLSHDPAFLNTASCRSAITFIDGDKGILRYWGYPVEELAGRASFLDVAYLLLRRECCWPERAGNSGRRLTGASCAAVAAGHAFGSGAVVDGGVTWIPHRCGHGLLDIVVRGQLCRAVPPGLCRDRDGDRA
jgi:Citrate synthase, C-terminal domain